MTHAQNIHNVSVNNVYLFFFRFVVGQMGGLTVMHAVNFTLVTRIENHYCELEGYRIWIALATNMC